MASIAERAVQIHFDRDEVVLMPRDTFVVLTGETNAAPTSTEGRRVGDVYIANLDLAKRTFDGAWYYTGSGWKQADLGELRAHSIAHPVLASRILSISPDGTSVNWSKRDTIVRRERRARTLSRTQTQNQRPTTPPPAARGTRSAPVTPHRGSAEKRVPPPLVSPTGASFPPPQTPRSPVSSAILSFATPTSSRSSRSAPSPLFSWQPGTPDTSFDLSPTRSIFGSGGAGSKYTVPQKRGEGAPSVPPTPTKTRRASVSTSLTPVQEDPADAGPIQPFVIQPQQREEQHTARQRSHMRPDAAEFVPTGNVFFQPPTMPAPPPHFLPQNLRPHPHAPQNQHQFTTPYQNIQPPNHAFDDFSSELSLIGATARIAHLKAQIAEYQLQEANSRIPNAPAIMDVGDALRQFNAHFVGMANCFESINYHFLQARYAV
ncbi:hypothetical protein EXIGLDRAFT_204544 [Exidia glandulosa HHB12029]|uniref:Uncharacterized protein n=1 Tax=Exidia glandulosa HHB12029 TaxID=1314781 RepID=A0A165EMZ8_EXIGL|nr:hypothetical protein EXIGLDRAFT_204544 [Exidia glandulosa HHB12029]